MCVFRDAWTCVCFCVCSSDLAWDSNRMSVWAETLLICTVQYSSPKPHVAIELLKCV